MVTPNNKQRVLEAECCLSDNQRAAPSLTHQHTHSWTIGGDIPAPNPPGCSGSDPILELWIEPMHHWRCSLGKCGTRIPKCPWSGRWSDWEVLGFASAENTKQTRIQLHARAFGVSHIHHQEQWETDRIHSQKQNRNMLAHNRQLKLATKIKTREVLSFEACFSSKSLSGSGSRILIRTSGSRILIWTSGSKILIRTSGSRILIWTSGSRILIWTSGSRILIWTSGSRILIWRQTRKNENQNFDLGMQV